MNVVLQTDVALRHGALLRVLQSPGFLPICFAVFVALRLALVILVPVMPSSDAAWYFDRATELAASGRYIEAGVPTAYWPIGYPAFLALLFYLFGASVLVGQMANLALGAASFVILYRITRELFRDEAAARLAVLMLTLYPNNAAYAPLLLGETLYTFLLLFGVLLVFTADRSRISLIGAGVVFGLATLVKTQTVLVFPLLVVVAGCKQWSLTAFARGIGRSVVVIIVALAVVSPWTWRNYKVFDTFVLVSTNGGMSLLAGNNPSMVGNWSRDYAGEDPLLGEAKFSVADQVGADARAKVLARQWILQDPVRFIGLMPQKFFRFWAIDGEGEWGYQAGTSWYDGHAPWFRAVRYANQAYYFLILILGAAAFFALLRARCAPCLLIGYVIAGFFTAISMVFSGQSRYHFPVLPFMFVYSAWIVSRWLQRKQRHRVTGGAVGS